MADGPASGEATAALSTCSPPLKWIILSVLPVHSQFLQDSPELPVPVISNAVNYC